jgi:hypothetical protein
LALFAVLIRELRNLTRGAEALAKAGNGLKVPWRGVEEAAKAGNSLKVPRRGAKAEAKVENSPRLWPYARKSFLCKCIVKKGLAIRKIAQAFLTFTPVLCKDKTP